MDISLSETDIASLLSWLDEIPISKPKKNITRDFSDGVATAEVVHHFCPKLVELFMYSPANAVSQKMYNWNTLNQKVFRKLGYNTQPELISCVVANKPGYVEYLLFELRQKQQNHYQQQQQHANVPDAAESIYGGRKVAGEIDGNGGVDVGMRTPAVGSFYGGAGNPGTGTRQAFSNPIAGMRSNGSGGVGVDEKDFLIRELQETVQMLQLKVTKLEQLLIVSFLAKLHFLFS
ncbi:Sperm flagellar protein 1 [Physocladia obscura]|uniref:Sperm flagellar protein 1 n=1 Tax=Physocladia obscura TaxID=109957 RepID=A0AAD5T8D7_9FUNG|nr:Sperm flagellar protein 1 [Physocladia obscura]